MINRKEAKQFEFRPNWPQQIYAPSKHNICFKLAQNLVLTVVNMHVLSLTAPQHPKKAVMNTMEPTIIDNVGARPKSVGNVFVTSLKLILYITPMMMSARPAN